MKVLIFVTDDGTDGGSGPVLFVKDFGTAILPQHPRSLSWRYFATVDADDTLLGEERTAIRAALEQDDPFISYRLIRRDPD